MLLVLVVAVVVVIVTLKMARVFLGYSAQSHSD